jgi:hypothetical protein
MNRTLAKGIFYLVAVVLLIWTASLTYSFVSMALPNSHWLVPLLALVVFDVGMVAWMYVFLSHAEGAIQRGVAITLCLFDFVGVGLMVMAEVLMGGQQIAAVPQRIGDAAIWGIGIWTVVNVLGVIVFHLGDPEARKQMAFQGVKDAVWEGAHKDLKQRQIGMSKQLSHELGGRLMSELLSELAVDINNNNVPDILEPTRPTQAQIGIGGNDGRMSQEEIELYIKNNPDALRRLASLAQPDAGQGGNGPPRPGLTRNAVGYQTGQAGFDYPYLDRQGYVHPRYDWQQREWQELRNSPVAQGLALGSTSDEQREMYDQQLNAMIARWHTADRQAGLNTPDGQRANPTNRPPSGSSGR